MARWAAVDHCAGRRRPSSGSGVRRTTSSHARNRSAMVTTSSTPSRPPERAQMCSTTSAAVKRADREHNPASGPTSAAATSSHVGAPRGGSFQHTVFSRSLPVAKPTAAASSRQRPWSSVGVSEWSFLVLVASEASSSACIRSAGDS